MLLKTFLLFSTLFSLNTSWAELAPARSLQELEKEAGEIGLESGPSAMSNVMGIKELELGLGPYLPERIRYSMPGTDENSIYDRDQATPAAGDSGTSTSDSSTER